MDILAHGLWTNAMFKTIPKTRNNKKIIFWGIAFGILPDLVSFVPVFVYSFYQSIFHQQPFLSGPPGPDIPFFKYAAESYNYTHSFVVWTAVVILAWIVLKEFPWVLLGWVLHIAIDIFTHTEAFFATPFLFPISGFKVSGISWAHPVFMIVNYSLLFLLYYFAIPKILFQKKQD